MPADPHDLQRFLKAQESSHAIAWAELTAGRKRSHWMWFVLPQLRGLGHSEMAHRYGIEGLAEAAAYLAHPVLGSRLQACVQAVLGHADRSALEIFGGIDAQKFQSCLTLFAAVEGAPACFEQALARCFAGRPDEATLRRL